MAAFPEKEESIPASDSAAVLAESPPRRLIARWTEARKLSRPFWFFLFASCTFNTGMFIYVLLYNLYLRDIGYREDFLGLINSFSTAGLIAGTFATVWLTRRIGMQRAVIICFAATATLAAARALVVERAALLGLTFLAGIFFALWAISIAVIIAQTTAERMRPIAYSIYLATVIGIGIVADPIGGRLPMWLDQAFGPASAAQTKQWALLVGSVFIYLAILPTMFLKLTHAPDRSRVRYPRSSFVFRFLAALALLNIATSAFNPLANVYFADFLKMPVHDVGLVFSVSQLAQVVAILLSPWILRRLGMVRGIACMEVATGLSLAILATGPHAAGAVIGYAGYMSFQWMDEPAMESLLMTKVEPEERSGAAAMMYMTIFASGVISTPFAGKAIAELGTERGYPAVMTIAALLLLAGGLSFGFLLRRFDKSN